MNSHLNEDTLFLSAQANAVFHLGRSLFGKVVTLADKNTTEGILYLSPQDTGPLSSLESYSAVIICESDPRCLLIQARQSLPLIIVAPEIVLSRGDVITVSERGRIHRHFRVKSRNNAFLVTEACNNLCIMCPQPPKPQSEVNETAIEERIRQTLLLIDDTCLPDSFCITGGEPTMLKEGLIRIVAGISTRAPRALIHLLTNGRYLANEHYTARLADAGKQQLLAGIPLFGHTSEIHDYVVQSSGAFGQTMSGLINCYRRGIKIELRVVLHKTTVEYLKSLAEFISRNLFFVQHVALMGMENMGFAKLNREQVFIDPWEYKDVLSEAIEIFSALWHRRASL